MSTLPDYTDYQLKESEMITKRLDPPLYNIIKRIPWLVRRCPETQLYLLTGNLYLMGEATGEASSSEEVTFVPEPFKTQQQQGTEETEQLWYTLLGEEDLEAATLKQKDKTIFFSSLQLYNPLLYKNPQIKASNHKSRITHKDQKMAIKLQPKIGARNNVRTGILHKTQTV